MSGYSYLHGAGDIYWQPSGLHLHDIFEPRADKQPSSPNDITHIEADTLQRAMGSQHQFERAQITLIRNGWTYHPATDTFIAPQTTGTTQS